MGPSSEAIVMWPSQGWRPFTTWEVNLHCSLPCWHPLDPILGSNCQHCLRWPTPFPPPSAPLPPPLRSLWQSSWDTKPSHLEDGWTHACPCLLCWARTQSCFHLFSASEHQTLWAERIPCILCIPNWMAFNKPYEWFQLSQPTEIWLRKHPFGQQGKVVAWELTVGALEGTEIAGVLARRLVSF